MKEPQFGKDSRVHLLVTTAIEETWGTDEPLVFLGEWCRLYDRKDVWTKRLHSVVRNHWDDREKLRRDHDYLKGLHESLLAELVRALNSYHQLDRPLRYWQIILDPWLLTYVAVIWDRWEYLRLAFLEHEHLETIGLESSAEQRPFFDYNDFIDNILGDPWNYRLFLEIVESNYYGQCSISRDSNKLSSVKGSHAFSSIKPRPRTLKYRTAEFIDGLFGKLSARNPVVFFASYFPPAALGRLNFNLRQLPRLYLNEFNWPIRLGDKTPFGSQYSSRNAISLEIKPSNSFEAFLVNRIVKDIPIAFVEGRSSLQAIVSGIPMKPKVILTANAHWSNDLFKLWCAEQVVRGVKLVTVEHGGGIPPALCAMSFEEDIADIKTTWTVPLQKKHTRLPASKLCQIHFKSTGKSLAVVGYEAQRYNFRVESAPKSGQIITHYEMVCDLYSSLNDKVKAYFLIKPYPNLGWNTRQQFRDTIGEEKVSNEQDYYSFLSHARVIVCTYPQTTFSEAMASGLPSILLYPVHLWETFPAFEPLLETLRAAKIVFHDPRAAATHINSIWDDPDQWWDSPDAFHARKEFRRQALNLDSDWLRQWTAFIKGVIE